MAFPRYSVGVRSEITGCRGIVDDAAQEIRHLLADRPALTAQQESARQNVGYGGDTSQSALGRGSIGTKSRLASGIAGSKVIRPAPISRRKA